MKRALISGVSGQDGAYLAKLLLQKGYEVIGTSRDAHVSPFANLKELDIFDQVRLVSMNLNDFRSVMQTLEDVRPHEIYSLAGQSSVGLSYQQPVETMESISVGTLNLLEAIRFSRRPIKLYNACSSECFGDTLEPADESTPFRPISPYAVAKAAAYWTVSSYREAYDIFACSGILYNHESPLRHTRFVTQKIVSTVCAIVDGENIKLTLGNLDIRRDWGWAPEYVEAMWLMLQQDNAEDYVVATGATHSLQDVVAHAFNVVGLDWSDHVVLDTTLYRPSDLYQSLADPSKAKEKLSWTAKVKMPEVIEKMMQAKLNS